MNNFISLGLTYEKRIAELEKLVAKLNKDVEQLELEKKNLETVIKAYGKAKKGKSSRRGN